MEQFDKLRS